MDQILEILKELLPYTSNVSAQLFYFLFAAIIVTLLHMFFPRIRIIKYIPGIVLVIFALSLIIFNGESSILRTNVNDLGIAIISGAVGLASIIFANLIGIMYGSNKKSKKTRENKNKNKKIQDNKEFMESVPVDKKSE